MGVEATGIGVLTMFGCEECGYRYDERLLDDLDVRMHGTLDRFRGALWSSWDKLCARPAAGSWCVLEYACHVRDVLLAQRERTFLMLIEDEPTLVPIYRDERVVLAAYNESDPDCLALELEMAVGLFTDLFGRLDGMQRARTCRANFYNLPAGDVRSIDWLALHTLHECVHHAADVERLVMT